MNVVKLRGFVDQDHRLVVELPPEIPVGDVTVVIETADRPNLDDLLLMPVAERERYLSAQAELAADFYRNDPELTATAETIDLYDYPDE